MNPQILNNKNRLIVGFIILIIFSLPISRSFAQNELIVESTKLDIFRDGLVHVSQIITINETYPAMTLQLFSPTIDNLIILDENNAFLDYAQTGSNLTIFTLGTKKVSIGYDTLTLTNKEAEVWTLKIDNKYNSTIYLPENSTIVYLDKIPNEIDTTENKIILLINPDSWEISYILPLISPSDPITPQDPNPFPLEYILATIITIIAVSLLAIFLIKRKQPNIKKIIKANPQLRQDEIDVIHFINQIGNKAFESQIRERFPDLPRTSLWRMIKRLEKNGIVKIKKIGLENQVELK